MLDKKRFIYSVICILAVSCIFLFLYFLINSDSRDILNHKSKDPWPNDAGNHEHFTLENVYTKGSLSHEEITSKREQIRGLGYMAGYNPAPEKKNVTIYKKDIAYNGLNLYSSGSEVILMDMMGKILHKWNHSLLEDPLFSSYLFHNGDLLTFAGQWGGLIKLDKNSKLIWHYRAFAHHEIVVTEDGKKIYTFVREETKNKPYLNNQPLLDEYVAILDSNGNETSRLSILGCLENSEYNHLLDELKNAKPKTKPPHDPFHENTIVILDGRLQHRSPAFKAGNILISLFQFSLICVIDPIEKRVVWTFPGSWKAHSISLLDDGHMLFFNNDPSKGNKSKIIKVDPFSQKIVYEYEMTRSHVMGSCARLPNGNIFITQSTSGRVFEITPDDKVVWEFFNPARLENENIIAAINEMEKLPPDFPLDWL